MAIAGNDLVIRDCRKRLGFDGLAMMLNEML
jgi:hypothetical protein